MAREVYEFPVTFATGTTRTSPQKTNVTMPPRIVRRIEITVPPGPRGEVGFQLGSNGTPFIPRNTTEFIVADGIEIGWDLDDAMTSGGWQVIGYNTGLFTHTLYFRFLCDLTSAGAAATQPINVSQLDQGPSGQLDQGPPPTDLPPPAPVPVPQLPPVPLPQLPALPPAPDLPGLPDLPSAPGLPGAAPAAPAPHYNFWSTPMGRLLTWPDQVNTTRFDEVKVLKDGSVGWYAWQGGAGQQSTYAKPPTNLGGNFVEVSGAFTLYQGVVRLNLTAVDADGATWQKVMNGSTFAAIDPPTGWRRLPAEQGLERV